MRRPTPDQIEHAIERTRRYVECRVPDIRDVRVSTFPPEAAQTVEELPGWWHVGMVRYEEEVWDVYLDPEVPHNTGMRVKTRWRPTGKLARHHAGVMRPAQTGRAG